MTELKNRIDSLTAILKSSTLGISKPEGKKDTRKKQYRKVDREKVNPLQLLPMKGKGLGTPAPGPSKGNLKPIQCYSCWCWGHGWREYPSKGNFNWRELSGAQIPPEIVEIGPKSIENKQ